MRARSIGASRNLANSIYRMESDAAFTGRATENVCLEFHREDVSVLMIAHLRRRCGSAET